ncbi:MAG: hypothetical protein LW828_10610 [Xanthomonadaceae bacterium]|jgi:hypothetical protein|nr:hypothetical protein [Xanthomonadaceae bacterium]
MTGLKIAHLARVTNFLSLLGAGGGLASVLAGLDGLAIAGVGLAFLSSLGNYCLSELQMAEAARLEAERDKLKSDVENLRTDHLRKTAFGLQNFSGGINSSLRGST